MSKDLRNWIEKLEAEGELRRIKARVDWDEEIAEIQRQVLMKRGPALLFENIKDHENTWCRRLFSGGLGTMGRTALMLGVPKDTPRGDMVELLRERFREPIKPEPVDTGPVKENIIKGDEVDLYQIPAPKWHPLDGGRYINTWCGVVTMDPDTGKHNVGVYRGMIGGRNKINVLLAPAQNWGIHYGKYQRRGEPMPVAMVYGWDPALDFTAGLHLSISEYEATGAIMQAPVPLVRCETSDLRVPASAEIVIEGTISPDPATYEIEGPYGESTGHYSVSRKRPVQNVDCITFRNDPIYRGATNESGPMLNVGASAIIWNTLEQQDIPGILDVAGGFFTTVKIHKTYQGQARHVAAAIWGSRMAVTMAKIIMVVDDERDINIHDPAALQGAMMMHLDPSRGLIVFPMELGAPSDPVLSPEAQDELEYGQALQDKLLIDATLDWTAHPRRDDWGGKRVSPDCNEPSPGIRRLVQERWQEYGLP